MKDSKVDGAFLGDVDGKQAAADIEVEVDANGVRFRVKRLGGTETPAIVESKDPKVRHYQLQVHHEMRRLAARHKQVTPDFKPEAPRKRIGPAVITCPSCNGIEPEKWDCEVCDGGGVVPG